MHSPINGANETYTLQITQCNKYTADLPPHLPNRIADRSLIN